MKLFFKECKQVGKSIVYLLFVIVLFLFYWTQFGNCGGNVIEAYKANKLGESDSMLVKPEPGADNYGYVNAEIPEQVIPAAIGGLFWEYQDNNYTTYPIGFFKTVRLNATEQEQMKKILEKASGLPIKELEQTVNTVLENAVVNELGFARFPYAEYIAYNISYEEFKGLMQQADDLLGGGSSYALDSLDQFASRPVTYDEALAEYNDVIYNDKITGTVARLFCDYVGISLALFSIFVPVAFMLRDRRANMQELIYSRKISSAKLILIRFFALVIMMMLPVFLLSLIPTVQLAVFAAEYGFTIDYFAFVKYILVWLLPTVLTTASFGMLLTILTDTPIAIAAMLVYSFLGIFAVSFSNLRGGIYGFEIAIRHNSLGNYSFMMENIDGLIFNRISYSIVAIILVLLSIVAYELKRKGYISVGENIQKIWQNIQKTAKNDA